MIKNTFPPTGQGYTYLQTNRSDDLGSLWSTFNNDYQTNLGVTKLSPKLVINASTADNSDLGLPCGFEYCFGKWFAICGSALFKNSSEQLTSTFNEDTSGYAVGASSTQFDITKVSNTVRYTYDGTGTNPSISTSTFPVGATVYINAENFNANNNGTFTVTNSASNYFEVTNASGTAESNKTIGNGDISVAGGSLSFEYDPFASDVKAFDGRLWLTTDDRLYSKESDSGAGTIILRDSISSSAVHKMVYFKPFDRLYFVDTVNTISSIDADNGLSNTTGDYFVDMGDNIGEITTMEAGDNEIWIAMVRTDDSSSANGIYGSICSWDGISAQVDAEYILETGAALAMTVHQSIPYAIDSEGRILKYTGYSFNEIGRLPINRTLLIGSSNGPTGQRFVHYNGMKSTKDNTLLILIDNLNYDSQDDSSENMQSGIWEFDLATNNFTHRYSFTLKTRGSSTVTDFGQNNIAEAGALQINTFSSDSSAGRSSLVCGATVYTNATAEQSGIYIDSPAKATSNTEGQKRGYFVTTWFNSDEISNKWSRLWSVYRRFLTSTDKIICKYRLNEEDPITATITWTSTTTFTTTTDVSAYAPTASPFNGTTGGEVEILRGTGGGSCTHISSIVNNAGTYTVTLDNVVTGVSGTAVARFQKWVKIFPEATGQVLSYSQMAINDSNTRIQMKVVMEFTGDNEFHKFILTSNPDIKAEL